MLSVWLLGDFCVRHAETPVTGLNTPRLQSLLAYLMVHRGAPQSRAHIAYLFWPDTTEAQARTNLRNLLHHLRHALPDADNYLDSDSLTLQWRAGAPFTLDVAEFESALADAEQAFRTGGASAARTALERAAALYAGDLLPSCYDDWIIPRREALRQAYIGALERLVDALEEQRDYQAAIQFGHRLLRHDPVQEASYRRLIQLHALSGDRAGALRLYHTCATVLRRELDVEPSAATRESYERLLGAETRRPPAVPAATAFSPLVGRDTEWALALQDWRAVAAGGEPRALVLRGEAGIGKTRLIEDLVQWAARQGIATAYTRCYAAEGELAYAPVTAWLRSRPVAPLEDLWLAELARLLPELLVQRPNLPRAAALTEAWQRQRLFEALSRAVIGGIQPLLLAMDDLQWCDRDTLEWLHYLLRYDRQARMLVVGAYRPEEVGKGHPLLTLLAALRLEGQVTEVDLEPLDEAATRDLATRVAGAELSAPHASLLYTETEGNPLFVVETVRAGLPARWQPAAPAAPGRPAADPSPSGVNLPPKVRSVLAARLAQVSPPTRELAELAATIGREFSFKLLAKASGLDEDTLVREIDELWQRRIVREHGADAYDFSHDKLREVVYGSMSAARRQLLHRHVAEALESIHSADLDSASHQVAAHLERAGLPEKAIPFYVRAAQVARRVYANEEAVSLLRRALDLIERKGRGEGEQQPGQTAAAAQVWEDLGDIYELGAQHAEALQAYASARARLLENDQLGRSRLHRKAGAVMREQRLYAEALGACQLAETALGTRPEADAGDWWVEWLEVQVERVWAHYWLAQWPEMDAVLRKLEPVVHGRGSPTSRMRFLVASCLMHLRKERYSVSDSMMRDTREALELSREWGGAKSRIECLFEVGFLHLWRRELAEAGQYLEAALELAQTAGVVPLRTLALTYLTVLCRFRGQIDAVRDYAARAQASAQAAHMPDYVAASKGNQAWLAWRGGDLDAAERLGREALDIWRRSTLVYPFQWLALWPLAAVALERGREAEAWDWITALLEPAQQLLPPGVDLPLQAAAQAEVGGSQTAARAYLDPALRIAREMGYL